MESGSSDRTRYDDRTERERNRARPAADVAEFLRRGGVIEDLTRHLEVEGARRGRHSPVELRLME